MRACLLMSGLLGTFAAPLHAQSESNGYSSASARAEERTRPTKHRAERRAERVAEHDAEQAFRRELREEREAQSRPQPSRLELNATEAESAAATAREIAAKSGGEQEKALAEKITTLASRQKALAALEPRASAPNKTVVVSNLVRARDGDVADRTLLMKQEKALDRARSQYEDAVAAARGPSAHPDAASLVALATSRLDAARTARDETQTRVAKRDAELSEGQAKVRATGTGPFHLWGQIDLPKTSAANRTAIDEHMGKLVSASAKTMAARR